MTISRAWLGGPRRLALSFLCILLVPAAAVVWLGLKVIGADQNRQTVALQERRQRGATEFVKAIEQAVTTTELQLRAAPERLDGAADDSTLLVSWRLDAGPEVEQGFEGGERLEFQTGDLAGAAKIFRERAAASEPAVRASALLRLARTEWKLGRPDAALATFTALSSVADARVAGLPAGFVGARGRCVVLAASSRRLQLADEARRLEADLFAARWPLDPDSWMHYLEEASAWQNHRKASIESLAPHMTSVAWLWRHAETLREADPAPSSGRHVIAAPSGSFVALWRHEGHRLTAFVAGPDVQRHEWIDPALTRLAERQLQAAVVTSDGRAVAGALGAWDHSNVSRASLADSGLPWTVIVADLDPTASAREFAAPRTLLASALALLLVVILGAGYIVARAVTRELAVAELQSDFVSAVSHEFRTPLTSMRQFTDLLNAPVEPADEKRRSFYQAQARATHRLQRLVESLLDFGRMEAGAHPYDLKPIDVSALVRDVAEEFRRDTLPQGFSLTVTAIDEATPVRADAGALRRALWNLLDNAVKYSGDGRAIVVSAERVAKIMHISVRDRGVGIPRAEQGRIFEKFFRGSAGRADGIRGTGIGLAMVHHIVRSHGGRVRVASEVGQGSTFTVELPTICPAS